MGGPVMVDIVPQELQTAGGKVVVTEIRLDGENVDVIRGRHKHAKPTDFDIWWNARGAAKHEPDKWDLDRTDANTERFIQYVAERRREFSLTSRRRRR